MVWECWGRDLRQSNDKDMNKDEIDSSNNHHVSNATRSK